MLRFKQLDTHRSKVFYGRKLLGQVVLEGDRWRVEGPDFANREEAGLALVLMLGGVETITNEHTPRLSRGQF